MTERSAFWKGVISGVVGAAAAAGLVRLCRPEESFQPRGAGRNYPGPKSEARPERVTVSANYPRPKVALRRESGESAGDPRLIRPGSETGVVEGRAFERPPGAPGGRTPAERLEVPGRPGLHIEDIPTSEIIE